MPRKFAFRLEAVLRVRQRALEERQRIVARRLGEIARIRGLVDAARAQVRAATDASRLLQRSARLDVPAVLAHRAQVGFLFGRIADFTARIGEHERQLERERAEMIQARVALKSIEKLRERRLARYESELHRKETAEESETALRMHRMRSTSIAEMAALTGTES